MSRQGNYVTVPNVGGNNAMSGLSGALTDLSKIMLAHSEQEQDKKQWEAEEGRRIEDHNYKLEGQAARALFAENYADGKFDNIKYKLDDYTGDLRTQLDTLHGRIVSGEDSLRGALTGGKEELNKHLDVFEDNLRSSGVTDASTIKDRRFERERRINALRNDWATGQYAPEDITGRIDEAVTGLYSDRRNSFDTAVASGKALTQKQQFDALMRRVSPEAIKHLDQTYLQKMLAPKATNATMEDLIAREKANVSAINKASSDNQSLAGNVLSGRGGSGRSSSKGYKPNYAASLELFEPDGKYDIGSSDNKKLKAGYDKLISAVDAKGNRRNYPIEAVKMGILSGIERGWIDDTFPDPESDQFKAIEQRVQEVADDMIIGGSSGYSGSKELKAHVDPKHLKYAAKLERLPHELQRELFSMALPRNNSTYLDVGDLKLNGELPSIVAARAAKAAEAAKPKVDTVDISALDRNVQAMSQKIASEVSKDTDTITGQRIAALQSTGGNPSPLASPAAAATKQVFGSKVVKEQKSDDLPNHLQRFKDVNAWNNRHMNPSFGRLSDADKRTMEGWHSKQSTKRKNDRAEYWANQASQVNDVEVPKRLDKFKNPAIWNNRNMLPDFAALGAEDKALLERLHSKRAEINRAGLMARWTSLFAD